MSSHIEKSTKIITFRSVVISNNLLMFEYMSQQKKKKNHTYSGSSLDLFEQLLRTEKLAPPATPTGHDGGCKQEGQDQRPRQSSGDLDTWPGQQICLLRAAHPPPGGDSHNGLGYEPARLLGSAS